MTLTFAQVMDSAGIDPLEALVIRHAYVREHGDGSAGIHGDSSDAEIMGYTSNQSANARAFPAAPPGVWVVFLPEGGDRARLWSVVRNHGETSNDGVRRTFDLERSDQLSDLQSRLVIGWRSPRTWALKATTAARYPVMEIADAEPVRFPGFDALTLDYSQLQAVVREHRYATWRTALCDSVEDTVRLFASLSLARMHPDITTWAMAAEALDLPGPMGIRCARACSGTMLVTPVDWRARIWSAIQDVDRRDYRATEAKIQHRRHLTSRWFQKGPASTGPAPTTQA